MKNRAKKAQNNNQSLIGIRRAQSSDAADLLKLIRAYYRFDGIRFRADEISPALDQLLEHPRLGCIWIMHDGIDPVGYLIMTFNFDLEFNGLQGLVTDLYVAEKCRGCGLGKRALEIVDDYCRSKGITTVELQVVEDNVEALAFYRRIGFTRLDRAVMTRAVKAQDGRSVVPVLVKGNKRDGFAGIGDGIRMRREHGAAKRER